MPVSTLTITGKLGPGNTVTSLVFNNVIDLDFQLDKSNLSVTYLGSQNMPKTQNFDIFATTTVTFTISAGAATVTISQ